MQTCSKCQTQSPDSAIECSNCKADLRDWSEAAVALKRYEENPRVRLIRIVVYDNCCPTCRQVKGGYEKGHVPKLPVQGCSHELGCRCFYQPFLDEIYP